MNEETILKVTNEELRSLLLTHFPQNKIGPVEESTRSFYEKKLIKHLRLKIQENIIPGMAASGTRNNREPTIPRTMDLNNNDVTDASTSPMSSMLSINNSLTSVVNETDVNTLSNDELFKLLRVKFILDIFNFWNHFERIFFSFFLFSLFLPKETQHISWTDH